MIFKECGEEVFNDKPHNKSTTWTSRRKYIDNSPIEPFWKILKSEMYYINKFYTPDNLINSIKEYIEFYNNKRFQAKLKCLTPMEYRNQALFT